MLTTTKASLSSPVKPSLDQLFDGFSYSKSFRVTTLSSENSKLYTSVAVHLNVNLTILRLQACKLALQFFINQIETYRIEDIVLMMCRGLRTSQRECQILTSPAFVA